MSRPFPSRSSSAASQTRVNGKIRAREVRVIGADGAQLGVMPLVEAINLARAKGVDLVEVAPNATPPVCRIVDFGKYRYELNKKEKESKKHQHANKVKEVQISPKIDPHDFGVKLSRAIDFLCEEMKVKLTLKFRGRENAHKEFGFMQIEKFTKEVAPFGHPDNQAKVVGKGITVMFSPLPRNKRAPNPRVAEPITDDESQVQEDEDDEDDSSDEGGKAAPAPNKPSGGGGPVLNTPFADLESKLPPA